MKNLKYLFIALMIPAFLLTGCKDEKTEDGQPAFEILKDYLIAQDLDLDKIMTSADGSKFVTGAPATDAEVAAWAENFYIIDIRSAEKFAAGHIVGAVNVPVFADVLTEAAKAGSKNVLMVCYTGQTACYATALLRLAGIKAQALKWGMSSWNASLDSWTNNCGNTANGNDNWTSATAPQNQVYENPTITSTSSDGASILAQQIAYAFTTGFKKTGATEGVYDVLVNPSAYHINNYFSEADYTGFGHIMGAYRINPLLLSDNSYMGLNPDAKVVTYCYTGQTSAIISAYLNVLGYDAYSLMFGMNGLSNSNPAWVSNQWGGDSKAKNLSTVTN